MSSETIIVIVLAVICGIIFLPILFILSWNLMIFIIFLVLFFGFDMEFFKSFLSAIGIFMIINYIKKGG